MKYLNPIEWVRWCGAFVSLWVISIPWVRVSNALPALFLAVAIASVGVIAFGDGSAWRDGLLEQQLKDAWATDDFATAELIIRRQLIHSPTDTKDLHNLALTLNARDQYPQAAELMRQLVELKHHETSARWLLAKEYFDKDWSKLDQTQKDEFGMLLKVVHQENPTDLAIKGIYADYLIAAEKFNNAIPILEELSRIQPMRGLQAAAISRSLGHETQANLLARRCLDELNTMSQEDPANSTLALSVAQNQLFLQRYAEAVETLYRAIPLAKTEKQKQQLSQGLGDGIVAWVGYIESTPIESLKERLRILQLLQRAVEFAPNNPRVMAMVADHVLATADETNEEVESVRAALIEGSSPGIAHFIQGTAALVNDDAETATRELTLAAELLPNSSAIMNNLAVALTARGDENLEQALKLANAAVENSRTTAPHFYETRGQILFRMKRYLEAIPDLERALAHPDLASKAHESLATCYAELGVEKLSKEHREAAERTTESPRQTSDADAAVDLTAR